MEGVAIDPNPADRILARLKAATCAEHAALEQMLDLEHLSLARYRRMLDKFLGFWRPLEARLGALEGWAAQGIDFEARRRVPALQADLRALDIAGSGPDRDCIRLPPTRSMADGFGCMYVLEGSTLGARAISRQLNASLGIAPGSGGRFFHAHGDRTGEMWRAFGAALTRFAASSGADGRTVSAAHATFGALRSWFDPER